METMREFRNEVSIPVLETTSAFARGVTLAEAFRLWQAHDHARKEARCYGGTKAPLNVVAMSTQANPERMRYCA
jgi:hypothetical protein